LWEVAVCLILFTGLRGRVGESGETSLLSLGPQVHERV